MKLPWKKENAAHKAPGGGKRRSFDLKAALTTRAVRVGGYSVAAARHRHRHHRGGQRAVRALPAQWTQFDTTSSQLFSISDQTESVVGSLETPVTIHWIVQSGQEDATLETLLERYQALRENLTVEKVDPVVSPPSGAVRRRQRIQQQPHRGVRGPLPVCGLLRHLYLRLHQLLHHRLRGHELRRGGGHYQRRQLCGQRRPAQGLHPHRPRGGLPEL